MRISLKNIYIFSIYLIVFSTFIVDFGWVELKYLKYIELPLFFFFFFYFKQYKLVVKPYVYPFILLIVFYLIKPYQYTQQGFMESIFIFSAFLIFLLPHTSKIKIDLRALSLMSIATFAIFILPSGHLDLSLRALIRSETFDIEGNMSFYFGLFALYFIIEKKYSWAFLNMIFMIIDMKRIVTIAFLVSMFVYILPKKISDSLLNKYFLISINIIYLYGTYVLASGILNDFIHTETGLSAGHFTMGRTTFISLLIPYLEADSTNMFLQGLGLGAVKIAMQDIGFINLLHNDVLKLFIENGMIIFIVFFYLLYSVENKKIKTMALMLNIIFFTDNSLIYTSVLILYFIMQNNFYLQMKNKRSKVKYA